MKEQNVIAMAAVLGMDKQANALTSALGRFARSGAGLPVTGGLVGAGLATPDALEALRSGDTTGAALRWGGGAAAGTGAGFLGRGLARTTRNLGVTNRALNTSRGTAARLQGELADQGEHLTAVRSALSETQGKALDYASAAEKNEAALQKALAEKGAVTQNLDQANAVIRDAQRVTEQGGAGLTAIQKILRILSRR